jgi:flagellar motor switch protein FliG
MGHFMNGASRAAVILLSLNDTAKRTLLAKLSDAEILKIIESIKTLGRVNKETVQQLLEEFSEHIHEGVIGEEQEAERLKTHLAPERLLAMNKPPETTWTKLESISNELLAEQLYKERPEIVAVLLKKLSNTKTASLLRLFPTPYAAEILKAYARLKPINEEIIAKVTDETLLSKLNALDFSSEEREAVKLLELLPNETADELLSHLDKSLAESLEAGRMTFEKLKLLDTAFLHRLMSDIPHELLSKALALSQPDEVEFFLLHLSKKAASLVEDDMELNSDLSIEDCHKARRLIVTMARELVYD